MFLLLLLLSLSVFNNAQGKKMCFDNKYECPSYTVVSQTKEFEVRRYPTYKFAIAKADNMGRFAAANKNFMKLFKYINGNNEKKVKIPMTVPVTRIYVHDAEGRFTKNNTMMFWIPSDFQCKGCTPTPVVADKASDQVVIITVGEGIAYVKRFGMTVMDIFLKYHEKQFQKSLKLAGLVAGKDYDDVSLFSMSYGWTRNELMYLKKRH